MFSSVDLFLPANFSAPFKISALAGNAGPVAVVFKYKSGSSSGKAGNEGDVSAVEVTGTMQGVSSSDSEYDPDELLMGGALALGVGGGAEVFGAGSDALVFGCGRAALVFGGG